MLKKVKGVLVAVAVTSVGTLAMAQDNSVKTAMDAIQADATSNIGIILPAALIITGLVIGAGVTMAVMRKIGNRIG